MVNPVVIGLNGKKQVGKDSFADFAEEILPGQVGRLSFAYPLKMFCVNYLGIPEINCFGSDFEKDQWVGTWGEIFGDNKDLFAKYTQHDRKKDITTPVHCDSNISGREVLQVVGTDIFRDNLNTNIWVDILKRRLAKGEYDRPVFCPPEAEGPGPVKIVLITDVRFPNEVSWIKEEKHVGVRIYRHTGAGNTIAHSSETVFDLIKDSEFDYLIDPQHNTSLKMLKKQVIQILNGEGLMDEFCD